MTVTDTSRRAYHEGREDGTHATEIGKILVVLQCGEFFTRKQLSFITGIEPGSVAGRVNFMAAPTDHPEPKKRGLGLLEKGEKIHCPITNKMVTPVRLKAEHRTQTKPQLKDQGEIWATA